MVVYNTPVNVNNVQIENDEGYIIIHEVTLQHLGKESGQTKNHGRVGGIRQTPGSLQRLPCHLPE